MLALDVKTGLNYSDDNEIFNGRMDILLTLSRYWNYSHMICQFEEKIDALNNASRQGI